MKFLALSLLFLSGCATVNYTYHGRSCDVLGYSEDDRDVLLKCPRLSADREFR